MRRRQIIDFLVYVVIRILICVVQAMRMEAGQRLARTLAWGAIAVRMPTLAHAGP